MGCAISCLVLCQYYIMTFEMISYQIAQLTIVNVRLVSNGHRQGRVLHFLVTPMFQESNKVGTERYFT